MIEYLRSTVEATQLIADLGKTVVLKALEWGDQKLCDLNSLGGDDER